MKPILVLLCMLSVSVASAQFVWPKPEYNKSEPGLYKEDPFIIQYRQKFFAVFRGDFKTFEKAYEEITEMVRKNPKDPRAMVWLGNGQTVKAGLMLGKGERSEAEALLDKSRKTLDLAVSLSPEDPNIYMMRAATLYIQGQYWDGVPRVVWERLRDDCEKFIKFVGEDRLPRASIHLRGETYGELGIAYVKLGEVEKARAAFQRVIELCPGTSYERRARAELAKLQKS